jgi:hypothetical protein
MHTFTAKAGWALAAVLGLTVVAVWTGVINAGSLDPPGPLGPTMKSLDDVPPSWHRTLSAAGGCSSERFACVLGNTAVLDRETGLVWERVPSTNTIDWDTALQACHSATRGGRMGWRLPTISELTTLSDTLQVSTGLPPGHPFTIGTEDYFWSSTPDTASTTRAFKFDFNAFYLSADVKSQAYRVWCVRAPAGPDMQ